MQAPKKTTPARDALRAKATLQPEPQPPITIDKQAVDEACQPLPPSRKDTAAIQAKALELYGAPAGGIPPIPLAESHFQFTPLESDADFCHLHVESLLDHAAGLLDRCIAARSERDHLHLEKWSLQLDLDRFVRLGKIQESERKAGADTLAYQRALTESEAERNLEENHRNSGLQLKGLTDDLLSFGFNKQMAAKEVSAWLSAYPLKDRELAGDDAAYVFDGTKRTKPEHLYEAARIAADEAAWERIYTLMAARFESTAAAESARLRKESLGLQAKWSKEDMRLRGQRAQLERDAGWEKIFQSQSPRGLLNFSERITSVERRFSDDFREALACLNATRRGLQELYGYAPPFPSAEEPGYFEEVVRWTRKAANRMLQLSQADQRYVLVLSLKELTKAQWESGRTAAQWTFEVPAEIFPSQAHVRLLGLGLAVVGPKPEPPEPVLPKAALKKGVEPPPKPEPPKPKGFWSARVAVPPTGTVKHLAGKGAEVDQSSLPVCLLGRIADRDSLGEPEIAGKALHNASPIGKGWKLTLSTTSTGGTPTEQLDDLQLYLHVAAIGMKPGS